jgi:hypothetical protein
LADVKLIIRVVIADRPRIIPDDKGNILPAKANGITIDRR